MAKTIVALFDDFSAANDAVRDLINSGFKREEISLVANDASGEYGRTLIQTGETETNTSEGASVGAAIGGVGGLLAGVGALTLPVIGPIVAAGPLATALAALLGAGAGAVVGGVTGSLVGALVDLGIPEETAGYYLEGVRRGGTLLTVHTSDDMSDLAVDILNRHFPVDINRRAKDWRKTGWTKFEDSYQPNVKSPEKYPGNVGLSDERSNRMDSGSPTPIGMAGSTEDPELKDHTGHQSYEAPSVGMAGSTEDPELDSSRRRSFQTPPTGMAGSTEDPELSGHSARAPYEAPPQGMAGSTVSFADYDQDFRRHFANSPHAQIYTYEDFIPAYRFGYDIAREHRYGHRSDWNEIYSSAEEDWEREHPISWERFKDSVQYAWERFKDLFD
ncbi:MAG: hypothetical protein VB089_05785 [Anaerolineaceae bacterium]|nr:hypothetical protein [Anaerolineaceae bacterium]